MSFIPGSSSACGRGRPPSWRRPSPCTAPRPRRPQGSAPRSPPSSTSWASSPRPLACWGREACWGSSRCSGCARSPSRGGWRAESADRRLHGHGVLHRDGDQPYAGPAIATPRRVRGLGAGRRTRRTLARGGSGIAAELNLRLGAWPGVKITPMFGRWGYFVGPRLFACFPLRAKDTDLWIRLSRDDQRRAIETPAIVPHRRMASSGWVELSVTTSREVGRAIRWLRRSYEATRAAVEREER